jgi:hypothetical protein
MQLCQVPIGRLVTELGRDGMCVLNCAKPSCGKEHVYGGFAGRLLGHGSEIIPLSKEMFIQNDDPVTVLILAYKEQLISMPSTRQAHWKYSEPAAQSSETKLR